MFLWETHCPVPDSTGRFCSGTRLAFTPAGHNYMLIGCQYQALQAEGV